MKTLIIPTFATEHLTKNILSKAKKIEIIFPNLNKEGKRHFPDREIYIRISKINKLRKKRIIILHSGAPKPNEGLIELELILQILKENKLKSEIFFTYFPYGTQDKVFKKGEANVAKHLIEKLVSYYKVKKIYTIDPHFEKREWTKKYPLFAISAVPLLIKRAKEDFGKNILFFSPDKGGERRTGIKGIKKRRLNSFKVKIVSQRLNFKRKIIGVVDDIIKTGSTLLEFYEFAKGSGAQKILALATHGIIPAGIQKVKERYFKLYLTNTVKGKYSNVDITDLILKTISKQ